MPLFAPWLLPLRLFGNLMILKTDGAGFCHRSYEAGGRKWRLSTVCTEVARPLNR